MRESLLDRFLKYVKVDTQAIPEATKIPSSAGQLELARIVAGDLTAAGVLDLKVTEQGYIYGTIPSNLPITHPAHGKAPILGFISHLDTAAECSGKDVKPQVIKNYQGQEIPMTGNPNLVLKPSEEPPLKDCIGHTIITTDGTTLLGADDKAGIAAIVEMAYVLKEHPEKLHGKIRIGIMPDEELGIGAEKLDLKEFGADFAYTIDGGSAGEIDTESFNGFKGKVSVEGYAAFPGYGKGIYLNATKILSEFVTLMNDKMWPEHCDGRQGIWWVDAFKGEVAHAEMSVFLRDFDLEGIEEKEKILKGIKEKLLNKYPKTKIEVSVAEQYKNYRYELDKDKRVVQYAEDAVKRVGLKSAHHSVRGGNDSCHLCFSGLLSTNLFIGMQRMHSLKEWVSLQVIEKAVETMVALTGVWLEKSQ
jgi:tripeptide aminopeptidase